MLQGSPCAAHWVSLRLRALELVNSDSRLWSHKAVAGHGSSAWPGRPLHFLTTSGKWLNLRTAPQRAEGGEGKKTHKGHSNSSLVQKSKSRGRGEWLSGHSNVPLLQWHQGRLSNYPPVLLQLSLPGFAPGEPSPLLGLFSSWAVLGVRLDL